MFAENGQPVGRVRSGRYSEFLLGTAELRRRSCGVTCFDRFASRSKDRRADGKQLMSILPRRSVESLEGLRDIRRPSAALPDTPGHIG